MGTWPGEGQCYQQSAAWIDMSISNYEDFYGHLYDVHLFDPTTPTGVAHTPCVAGPVPTWTPALRRVTYLYPTFKYSM